MRAAAKKEQTRRRTEAAASEAAQGAAAADAEGAMHLSGVVAKEADEQKLAAERAEAPPDYDSDEDEDVRCHERARPLTRHA